MIARARAVWLMMALAGSVSDAQPLPGGTVPGGTLGAETPYPPLEEPPTTEAPPVGGGPATGGGGAGAPAAPPASALFSSFDTNGDGVISLSEAEAYPALRDSFDRADLDADGQLSPGEFAALR